MKTIIHQSADAFWTAAYGAFRWHPQLKAVKAQWFLVSSVLEFDRMRGLLNSHIECVVDDFGNLVGVPA